MKSDSYRAFGLLLAQVWGSGVEKRVLRPAGTGSSSLMLAADRLGNRHLLAPIEDGLAIPEQHGETLTLSEWRHDTQRYLDLTCLSDSLSRVFANLADDVVHRVEVDNEEPARALLATLAEWRQLLKSARALSEDQTRGLFAELFVLGKLAQRSPGYALDLWTGPDNELHDFISPNGDIEVKSSATEGLDVVVSSLNQLDPQEDRPLVLIRIQVANSPNGQRISDLVDELCQAGLVRSQLVARLGDAGYLLGSDPDQYRFHVVGIPSAWAVDSQFPGLRASELPERRTVAIRRVSYTLNLVAAGEPMSGDELGVYMDRLVQA